MKYRLLLLFLLLFGILRPLPAILGNQGALSLLSALYDCWPVDVHLFPVEQANIFDCRSSGKAKQLLKAEQALLAATALRSQNARAWHNLGIVYLADGRLSEAAQAFEISLQIQKQPLPVLDHLFLGNALVLMGNLDGGITEWRSARASPLFLERARYWGRQGSLDLAELSLDTALLINPVESVQLRGFTSAYIELGNLYRRQNDLDLAKAAYAVAVLGVDWDDRSVARAYHEWAVLHLHQREWQEAEEYFNRAIELAEPNSSFLITNHIMRGYILRQAGKFELARRDLQLAIDMGTPAQRAWAYDELGQLLMAQDQIEIAIDAYKEAVVLDPTKKHYRSHLAQSLVAAERIDEALIEYERLITDYPDDESLGNRYEQLKRLGQE